MTTKSRILPMLLSAVLWLSMHQSAHAFYNPSSGRWLSRDPIGERGGPNSYCLGKNNPVRYYDVLGLSEKDPSRTFPIPVSEGVFTVRLTESHKSLDAFIAFKPNAQTCSCKRIRLVQIVKTSSLDGSQDYQWTGKDESRNDVRTKGGDGVIGGYGVDHNPRKPPSIYFNDNFDYHGDGTPKDGPDEGSLGDPPHSTNDQSTHRMSFETCARCADSGQERYCGCVKWGFFLNGDNAVMDPNPPVGGDQPSSTFTSAVSNFNTRYGANE